jgi:hypothetical protein
MAGKSDYLENKVLDHVLGGTSYTKPASVYLGLYTVAPTDAGGGTEVAAASYARYTMTNNATNWPNAVSGSKSNGVDFVFATANEQWGTIVAFGIFDAPNAGNLLYWGLLNTSKLVDIGDTPIFRAGTLTVTED